jgi:MFS family permease
MEPFKRNVGDTVDANGNPAFSSGSLSLLASIVQVGELFGSLSAGFVGDRVGRCGGFTSACILLTIGIILQLVKATGQPIFVVVRASALLERRS